MLDGCREKPVKDQNDLFAKFMEHLASSDTRTAILQCEIATPGQRIDKTRAFRALSRMIGMLARHFDKVLLANTIPLTSVTGLIRS